MFDLCVGAGVHLPGVGGVPSQGQRLPLQRKEVEAVQRPVQNWCVCVCVRARARVYVRACVRACVRAFVRVRVLIQSANPSSLTLMPVPRTTRPISLSLSLSIASPSLYY